MEVSAYYQLQSVGTQVKNEVDLKCNAKFLSFWSQGNGAGFTKLIERLIRGVWTPTAMEFMQPSFPTKACIVASIIFVLDQKTDLISAPHSLVYFGIVIFFVYFKVIPFYTHSIANTKDEIRRAFFFFF